MHSARSSAYSVDMLNIISQLRSMIRNLAHHATDDASNDDGISKIITHICDIISTMIESDPQMNPDRIRALSTITNALDDQIKQFEDQPGRYHNAMVAFTKLLAKVLSMMQEEKEAAKLAKYSSLDAQGIQQIWERYYMVVDYYASTSGESGLITDLYDELIVLVILDSQREGLISEDEDSRSSPRILAIVEDLTRGLFNIRNMSNIKKNSEIQGNFKKPVDLSLANLSLS